MFKKIITPLVLTSLAACSGGGSSDTDIKTGTIELLAGVDYRTETQSGILNSSGEFNYKEGESLTLLLGDMTLASLDIAGDASLVTLLKLDELPDSPLTIRSLLRMPEFTRVRSKTTQSNTLTKGTHNDLHITSNIMRLLIALDNDNDATNGFDLTDNNEAITGLNLNFNTSLYEFSGNYDVKLFQHNTGISFAMDNARPLREAYALADLDISVPVRTNADDGNSYHYSYNNIGQVDVVTEISGNDESSYEFSYSPLSDMPVYDGQPTFNRFGLELTSAEGDVTFTHNYDNDRVFLLVKQGSYTYDGEAFSDSDRLSYNDAMQVITSGRYSGNTTENEVFEYGDSYTYDDEGRYVRGDYQNLNSNSQSSKDYSYSGNAQSSVITERSSSGYTQIETFDMQGRLITTTEEDFDENDEITSVETITYTYDEADRISQRTTTKDTNNDGTIDTTTVLTFTYGDAGLTEIVTTEDAEFDSYTVTYGSFGEVLSDSQQGEYIYGDVATNGISYLINEYRNYTPNYYSDYYLGK